MRDRKSLKRLRARPKKIFKKKKLKLKPLPNYLLIRTSASQGSRKLKSKRITTLLCISGKSHCLTCQSQRSNSLQLKIMPNKRRVYRIDNLYRSLV